MRNVNIFDETVQHLDIRILTIFGINIRKIRVIRNLGTALIILSQVQILENIKIVN